MTRSTTAADQAWVRQCVRDQWPELDVTMHKSCHTALDQASDLDQKLGAHETECDRLCRLAEDANNELLETDVGFVPMPRVRAAIDALQTETKSLRN